MSIVGKILAFVNIVGALGFLCLASLDYAKRQAWSHSDFVFDVRINGLPLDATVQDPEGQTIANKLGPQTLAELFGQAGQPVTTQVQEVQRVQEELRKGIQAANDPAVQSALYARVLLPLARTNTRREYLRSVYLRQTNFGQAYQLAIQPQRGQAMRPVNQAFASALAALQGEADDPLAVAFIKALTADPRKPFDQLWSQAVQAQQAGLDQERTQLQKEFDQTFQDAQNGTRTDTTPGEQGSAPAPVKVGPDEQRRDIAYLLFNLTEVLAENAVDQQPEGSGDRQPLGGAVKGTAAYADKLLDTPAYRQAHERVLVVVGLRQAVAEIQEEALLLQQIGSQLSLERARERNDFVLAYQGLLAQLQDRGANLEALNAQLARQRQQLADQQELVKRRQQDIKRYQSDLADSRQATAERVKEVRNMSQQLYELRLQVRDALAQNQQYVQQIRKLEQGR